PGRTRYDSHGERRPDVVQGDGVRRRRRPDDRLRATEPLVAQRRNRGRDAGDIDPKNLAEASLARDRDSPDHRSGPWISKECEVQTRVVPSAQGKDIATRWTLRQCRRTAPELARNCP